MCELDLTWCNSSSVGSWGVLFLGRFPLVGLRALGPHFGKFFVVQRIVVDPLFLSSGFDFILSHGVFVSFLQDQQKIVSLARGYFSSSP